MIVLSCLVAAQKSQFECMLSGEPEAINERQDVYTQVLAFGFMVLATASIDAVVSERLVLVLRLRLVFLRATALETMLEPLSYCRLLGRRSMHWADHPARYQPGTAPQAQTEKVRC